MNIELEFPVEEEDLRKLCVGDVELDFSRRAFLRVREHLETLLESSPFEHYHILLLPDRKKVNEEKENVKCHLQKKDC
jgi:hypothetical protein